MSGTRCDRIEEVLKTDSDMLHLLSALDGDRAQLIALLILPATRMKTPSIPGTTVSTMSLPHKGMVSTAVHSSNLRCLLVINEPVSCPLRPCWSDCACSLLASLSDSTFKLWSNANVEIFLRALRSFFLRANHDSLAPFCDFRDEEGVDWSLCRKDE